MFKQYKLRNYKFILVMYVVILNVIGILLIGSAKPSVQSKQIFGMIAGLTIMVMLSLIDYNFILKFSWLIYFFMVGVLLLVMFAGDDAGGAQRWFEIRIPFPAFRTGKNFNYIIFRLLFYET